ncbi:ABC transporter ATP-binding protein [Micromonospora cathayae]|uniref:ABC transporter ATP-binding protein n=1 Tax=Micromonospora cathayae TaxID=3028804 RepID=A0ABY7ZLQ6_9ACTN|nr:ABC transporter ATP-binding protein [Micromonospora sp. HUAS 3]WDZ83788.1 ABC transporter ATP-binding protein [Micromonospora sp. HUAS 3]
MLTLTNISARYGKIEAVRDVTLAAPASGVVALIGANGAGKSTTLRTIAGLHPAGGGTIVFDGQDITRTAPHRVVRMGLALVPEGRMVVAPLTVTENLRLSGFARRGRDEELLTWVYELFPRLKERRTQRAGSLSGGEQQMLAVGRALMTNPKMLLLDEPSMGLSPRMAEVVLDAVATIAGSGIGTLLVEQNAQAALDIAGHAYVLRRGEVVLSGPAREIMDTDEVRSAYLG